MQPSISFENRAENKAPRLVSQTHYCVMGDVTVADDVAIAPGVVLKASPGSRIVIASGACLAGGVCIQSRKGVLTIGANANLGANVLVVGHGEIGAQACISPGSTLMNPQVETEGLVPPGSLVVAKQASATASAYSQSSAKTGFSANSSANNLSSDPYSGNSHNGNLYSGMTTGGFTSGSYVPKATNVTTSFSANTASSFTSGNSPAPTRQVTVPPQNDSFVNTFVEPPPIGPKAIKIPSLSDQNGQYVDPAAQNNGVQLNSGYGNNNSLANNGSASNSSDSNGSDSNGSALSTSGNHRVYGKDQVSQLLSTLFPHR